MQYYDINVGVNKPQEVSAQGKFIYFLSGSAGGADSTIAVRMGNSGDVVLLKPGQSFRMPTGLSPIDRWTLSNFANILPIIGVVLIGEGEFEDNRISGSVEVIDGGRARTTSGAAFIGSGGCVGVAAQNSILQIWNPAGSAKNIVVKAFDFWASSPFSVNLAFNTVALGAVVNQMGSKLAGGALSVGEIRALTQSGAPAGLVIQNISAAVNVNSGKVLQEPIVIPPGRGLFAASSTVNMSMVMNVEAVEEGI